MDSKRTWTSVLKKLITKQKTKYLTWRRLRCGEADQRLEWLVKQKWHNDVWLERTLYSQNLVERSYGVVSTCLSSIQLETLRMWNYKGKKQLNLDALVDGTYAPSAMYTERDFLLDENPIGGTFSKEGFLEAPVFFLLKRESSLSLCTKLLISTE